MGAIDALFTAASAVCVTGLATVDTATEWSLFGQLGIVTASVIAGLALAGRLRATVSLGSSDLGEIRSLLKTVVMVTVLIEGVSTLALTLRFWAEHDTGLASAAWRGVFHAVSAYNNAG